MASSQNGKIGRTYISPITSNLTINNIVLVTQDIANWKAAIDSARSFLNPRRKLLYDLYNSIILDGQIETCMNKRAVGITNRKVQWIDKDGKGESAETVENEVLYTPWFYDFLTYIMNQVSWGHNLIELVLDKGIIKDVVEINRYNVMPEYGFLSKSYTNPWPTPDGGWYYRDDPQYSPYLIEIGKPKTYGLMMVAAQYVIYKRGGFGDWAQFAELFGMPFRVGKYSPYDDASRKLLEDGLEKMGGAGYSVIPDGTSLEFHQNNGTGQADIFDKMVARCDEQISKIYLGGTMTTDNGSSRSQSETHAEGQDDITLSDMIRVQHILNFSLKPKLIALGYSFLEGGHFQFPETVRLSLDQQFTIDKELYKMIPMPMKYFYEKYGVEPPADGEEVVKAPQPIVVANPNADPGADPGQPAKDQKPVEKKKPEAKLKSLGPVLKQLYKGCNHKHHPRAEAKPKSSDKIWERITKGIHDGTIKPGSVDPELHQWIVKELFNGVTKGYGGKVSSYGDGTPDRKMIESLENDVHVFSAFKTYQELRQATDLLTDDKGNVKPFSEFKADVLSINEEYNVTYLEAEYNQAIASAQMASNWTSYQDKKDVLPNLTYRTAGDDRVREEHQQLEGITALVDDPFWSIYYPPNDWGCRCDTEAGEEGGETDLSERSLPELPEMFQTNTAASGTVFPDKHPYYDVRKEDQKKADKLWGLKLPNPEE